jgi:hypothetical protein
MIFYRGPEVRISHERLWVLGPEPHDHATADLRDIRVVIPAADHSVAVLACSGTALMAAAVSFAATDLSHPAEWVCTVLALGIAALQLRAIRRAPARRHELWAFDRRHNQVVRLYATTNGLEFGRVRRALVRAMEWNAT